MLFRDCTQAPPAPTTSAATTVPAAPSEPGAPAPPWRVEYVEYAIRAGVPPVTRPTKIRPDGTRGDILHDPQEVAWWAYATWLEGEIARLKGLAGQSGHAAHANAVGAPAGGSPMPAPEPLEPANGGRANTEVSPHTSTPNATGPQYGSTNAPEPQHDPPDDKRTRAIRELRADPTASNAVLAARANTSDEFVRKLRHQLLAGANMAPVGGPLLQKDGSSPPTTDALDVQAE